MHDINKPYELSPKIKLLEALRKCSELQKKGFMALYSSDDETRTLEAAIALLPDNWIESIHKQVLSALKTDTARTLDQIKIKYPTLINELAKLWQIDRSAKIIQAGIKSQEEHNLLLRAAYERSALD